MAPGDGISLPTTLAQMGNVAKTQAKSQAGATQTAAVPGRLQEDENLKVSRVKETENATQNKIDPKQDNPDKRKRRRLRRSRKRLSGGEEATLGAGEASPDPTDPDAEQLGRLIDLRV